MQRTILYHLFRIGAIPKKLRPVLEEEGILVYDEGIGGWLIMKDFRAPGKRFKHRMEGFSGFLAITYQRLIAYAYWKRIINIPLTAPEMSKIHCAFTNPNRLEISFDSSSFHEDWQGMITIRFTTAKAQEFYDQLLPFTQEGTLS